MKNFLICFLLFVGCTGSGMAQPYIDIVNYFHQQSRHSFSGNGNRVSSFLNAVTVTLPLHVDSDFISINPGYENFNVHAEHGDFTLQSFSLPLSWLHQWNNSKYKTAFVFITRSMSKTSSSFQENTLQLGGAVLFTYEKNKDLKYKAGLYYNNEFFGPFFIPLLGIDWRVSPQLNLFGTLPNSLMLEYKCVPGKLHTGVSFRSLTNSWRWSDDEFIRFNDNHLRLFADVYVTKNHVITLEAGHSILRKYKLGKRDAGRNMYQDLNVSDGWLIKAGYSFRIRTDAG